MSTGVLGGSPVPERYCNIPIRSRTTCPILYSNPEISLQTHHAIACEFGDFWPQERRNNSKKKPTRIVASITFLEPFSLLGGVPGWAAERRLYAASH